MFDRSKSAGHLVNQAARHYSKHADRHLKALGLSSGQIPVLLQLAPAAVLSQKSLVQGAAIEQPTMAATLARMERDGLVERTADPTDRRTSLFKLTVDAREKLPGLFQALNLGNAKALQGLSPDERSEFLRLLNHVIRNLAKPEPADIGGAGTAELERPQSRRVAVS